ncbi:MAG: hypothetical protein AMXMBFR81_24660 [Chthonomonas sp.]
MDRSDAAVPEDEIVPFARSVTMNVSDTDPPPMADASSPPDTDSADPLAPPLSVDVCPNACKVQEANPEAPAECEPKSGSFSEANALADAEKESCIRVPLSPSVSKAEIARASA